MKQSVAKHVAEIIVAAGTASIASRRAILLESGLRYNEERFTWVLYGHKSALLFKALEQPSTEVALVSCVVLWYTVSSFAIRRRGLDQYQLLFFLIAGGAVAGVAVVVEASKHVVLLAYVPWAACLAMAVSSAAHTLWRQMLQPEANQDMLTDGKFFAP
ncbi:hypothetical protein SPBR_08906 [Sporothrix brasiliensis 5110]|uniref:Uncharacterized protein n=1 Tax=Sporothrix brasiliensis 5110 TaxID=1398154 RepID=A0A0C2IJ50_9PEZI|nr:uncharacterized protein SPBR_08906 [Sporothrix brasiliensis 5110]KIH87005.1 hypothetical protein SPBR_08906 [Sporothrix brasiliensis 5110]